MVATPPAAVSNPNRLATLHQVNLLDTPDEIAFDRLTRLVSKLLHAPVALVSLVDKDRQFFKSSVGLPEPWASQRETPLSHSFCQHVVEAGAPLIITDAHSHALVHDNLAIPDLNVIAYAGFPLTMANGHVLGSFCAIDTKPRVWTQDELEILEELALAVSTEIELRSQLIERERTQVELRHAKEAADAANMAKSMFLAHMSHELRTPLNAIIGYSELLLEEITDLGWLQIQPDLAKIQGAGQHLLALVDDVLDVAKIEAGKMEVHPSPFDLAGLLDSVVTTVQPSIEKNANRFVIMHDQKFDPMISDETKVRQILLNLLSNAAKFTGGGKVELHVTAQTRGERGHGIIFKVIDTGIGMTPEQIEQLFQPFAQVNIAAAQQHSGSGLGLALSRRLCHLLGGDINVNSKYGIGSTFTVWLPNKYQFHQSTKQKHHVSP
jgi:signal transduction histidine kinase